MSLNKKDVAHIAKLARIKVNDDESQRYADELNGIFGMIEQLSEVNTEGVPEMAGVGGYNLRVREDNIDDGNLKDAVLSNAPQSDYDCYIVPKVVE